MLAFWHIQYNRKSEIDSFMRMNSTKSVGRGCHIWFEKSATLRSLELDIEITER